MQIGGSKYARIGVLFNANDDASLPSLLFMKVFEITASSYGLAKFLNLVVMLHPHNLYSVVESLLFILHVMQP